MGNLFAAPADPGFVAEKLKKRYGMKWRIAQRYAYLIPDAYLRLAVWPTAMVNIGDYVLLEDGVLVLGEGYRWNGTNWPSFDRKTNIRGSALHDAAYQLMHAGLLDWKQHKGIFDAIFRDVCVEDGMRSFEAWYHYHAVRLVGGYTKAKQI